MFEMGSCISDTQFSCIHFGFDFLKLIIVIHKIFPENIDEVHTHLDL